jgi:ferredoxin-nitrate reductase
MTNAGRYVALLNKVVDAPGEALPDAEIICGLPRRWALKDLISTMLLKSMLNMQH